MYERFTDRAHKVMHLANQEARRSGHDFVGTEHILLALAREGVGHAATVLKQHDITLFKIYLEIERLVPPGPHADRVGKLPQSPRVKKVIEHAIAEARHYNRNYVGTEHVLLGLMREEESVAAQVLSSLGLRLEEIRDDVRQVLGMPNPLHKDSPKPIALAPTLSGPHTSTNLEQNAGTLSSLVCRHRDGCIVGCSTLGTLAGLLGGAVFLDLAGAVLAGATLGLLLGAGCATLLPE